MPKLLFKFVSLFLTYTFIQFEFSLKVRGYLLHHLRENNY